MKLYIRAFLIVLPLLILFTACDDVEELPYETDDSGRVVFETDENGNTVLPTDEEGNPIPIHTDAEGRPIVFTDEDGVFTPFTDVNGGPIAYVTDCSGDVVTDSYGYPQTEDTTKDPMKPRSDLKIGFIYTGSAEGNTLNNTFEMARMEMERLFGVETCYVENVLVQQFDSAVNALKAEGCNLIVAASNHFVKASNIAARNEFDGTIYISFGGSDYQNNLASVQPLLYQPANVCGLVAAYNTQSNKIGIVADNNFYNVNAVVDAFALGIEELPDSSVEVMLNWALSDSYSDTRNAIDDLVAGGCDVIFLYQSTEHGIKYCESLGVKNIGFSYKMPELAPTTYLTGFYLNLNNYLNDRVSRALYNNMRGDWYIGGLSSKTVSMGVLNEEICKEGTSEITAALYQLVFDETSAVFTGEIRDQATKVRVEKGMRLTKNQILDVDWLIRKIRPVKNFSAARTEDQLYFSDLTVNY